MGNKFQEGGGMIHSDLVLLGSLQVSERVKDYKVNQRNSTVLGYPGRYFDWSKFDWEGKQVHKSILKGQEDMIAPIPYVDDFLIADNCQYLHIPYEWEQLRTIYRVRPNDCMWAGAVYRGKLVKSQKAIKKEDGWYWRLEFEKEVKWHRQGRR